MSSAKFKLMDKKLNLDEIEGKYSAFARVPFALAVGMSKPIAENGYGKVLVDGVEISKGKRFTMEIMGTKHCMLIPVGEVAREYDKEYDLEFKEFVAEDGTPFKDQKFTFRTMPRPERDMAYEKHDEIAICAAREGIVLLQNNNNVLPLKADETLNCFGKDQYIFRNTSTGASLINPRWQANFHQAIEEHSSFMVNKAISELYSGLKNVEPSDELLDEAKRVNDLGIIVISRVSGEFLDNKPIKGEYYLTDEEETIIRKVSAAFGRTIAIINSGYPIEMGWINKYGIDSVIYTGFAGMGAGFALMEILDGRTNPRGKLSDTWTFDYYDNPSAKNFINFKPEDKIPGEKDNGVHIYYEEDIYVGYRYFSTFDKKVAFPFGHGLTYTSFETEVKEQKWDGNCLKVKIAVKNTGEYSGKEVMQLYMKAPDVKLEKPTRVLAAFEKTGMLAPTGEQVLELVAEKINFASFDEESGAYILEAGIYEIYCGNSVTNAIKIGEFIVEKEDVIRIVNHINLPVETFHKLSKEEPYVQEDSKLVALSERFTKPAARPEYEPTAIKKTKTGKVTFDMLLANPLLTDDFVAQMSDKELCTLNVCGGANWYLPWQDGSAGKTNALKQYKLPRIKVSDGNTGIHINKKNVGFPSSTVIAATFNKELAYEVGKVIGEESKENRIAINLGPGMNIHRNILNGRHPEYFSEDPYLAGMMAGMHGKGLVDSGTGCTYKHLFCNNSDTSRKGSHSIVSERALREIYYRVFEVAFHIQKPTCVMTSYNAVNGIYPAENADVIQKLIRGEWKFEGMIMTDWGTYDTVDPVEMVKAGNCWLTEGSGKYVKILRKAVKDGRLPRKYLEANAKYLIKTIFSVVAGDMG